MPQGHLHFHCAPGFCTQILAYMLDSLVRVSRRVDENHFVSITLQRDISRVANDPELRPRTGQRPKDRRSTREHQRWSYSVPSQQFQALFNSLFKVLCIFPSRYLFAIGLSPVFSFRRNLPPTLSCTPKQLDSSKAHRTPRTPRHRRDSHPPRYPVPRDFSRGHGWRQLL